MDIIGRDFGLSYRVYRSYAHMKLQCCSVTKVYHMQAFYKPRQFQRSNDFKSLEQHTTKENSIWYSREYILRNIHFIALIKIYVYLIDKVNSYIHLITLFDFYRIPDR